MQAVLLAGGKGTRLKPYTVSLPKPLVPVGDQPIIEIIIRQLVRAGTDEIIISTGHLAGLIEAYCGNGRQWGTKIRYIREDKPLNTAGALKLIGGLQENFLVMNGDVLSTLNYGGLFREHLKMGAAASVTVQKREFKVDFGIVTTDSAGFLEQYTEKPAFPYLVSIGVYVMNRQVLDLIKQDEAIGMPDLLLRIKNHNKKVYCHQAACSWLDIGRVEDYEKAQDFILANHDAFQ